MNIAGKLFGGSFALFILNTAALSQIPEGWEIREIAPAGTGYYCGRPDINDRGQIVFDRRLWPSMSETEIILYDRGRLVQLTTDHVFDGYSRLNNHGVIVWSRDLEEDGLFSIVRWQDGELDVISEPGHPGYDDSADINDAGFIVWDRNSLQPPDHSQVILFDGSNVRQLTNDLYSNQGPRINQHGDIVYTRYNFSTNWESEILGFFGIAAERLSSGQPRVQYPDINDYGQVVWHGYTTGIELWENGHTTTIVAKNAAGAHINNRQEICMSRVDTVNGERGIWLWRDGQLQQLTDGVFGGNFSAMNNRGEIAFQYGRVPSYGIALFTKLNFQADLDQDADVDLLDFALLQRCFGRGDEPIDDECWGADANGDSVVNIEDLRLFLGYLIGPE